MYLYPYCQEFFKIRITSCDKFINVGKLLCLLIEITFVFLESEMLYRLPVAGREGGGTPLFGLTVAMFGPMVYRDTYTYGEFKSSTGCTISLFDVLNRVWTLAVRGLNVLYPWDQFLETESFLILGYQMSLILVFNTIAKWIAWDTWFLSFFLCFHFLSIKLQLNRFKIQPS